MGRSGKRITIIVVSAAIILTCIIFAIPFNTVPFYTVEIYQDTEIKQEPYTVTESYVSLEVYEREETIFEGSPYSVPLGISVPFHVAKPDTRLVGNFKLPATGGFYLYSSSGKILYEQLGSQGDVDISLTEGEYKAILRERVSWEERVYLNLKLKWTEPGEVTKYREITKYREVPVIVERQQTVTNYRKASFWEIIFGH